MAASSYKTVRQRVYPFVKYKEWTFFPWPCIESDPEEFFKQLKNFKSKDGDILFCSSPKSGTHWLHEILCMLMDQTTEYSTDPVFYMNSLDNLKLQEGQTKPRILHTHMPFSFLPTEHIKCGRKIVYITRNPKDRHASFYNFLKGKIGIPDWSWDDYFNKSVLHDTLNTGWFNYTKEMASAIENKSGNIYQLTYEDLLLNTQEQIELLVEFLGLPCDENFVKQVVEKCKFHNLKDNKVDITGVFHPEGKSTLFRKGVIGDWKNWFTVAQNEQFDEIFKREMIGVNLRFIYE